MKPWRWIAGVAALSNLTHEGRTGRCRVAQATGCWAVMIAADNVGFCVDSCQHAQICAMTGKRADGKDR